ncbi:MAG: hypothetical protein V8R40_06255 [Dysosmobacter sp.]
MEKQTDRALSLWMEDAFRDKMFLRKLGINRTDLSQLFDQVNWRSQLSSLVPIRRRISCAEALNAFRPLLDALAPEPEEGWLRYAYQVASSLLYPAADTCHTSAQWDGALCFLQFLQVLFAAERRTLPFDPWLDFAFCTDAELAEAMWRQSTGSSSSASAVNTFWLLRLGREVTPFHTLEHVAGVHHVAMTVSRAFRAGGGLIDLGLISGAAAGHDLGKFGCKPGITGGVPPTIITPTSGLPSGDSPLWAVSPPTTLSGIWRSRISPPSHWFWSTLISGSSSPGMRASAGDRPSLLPPGSL